MAKGHTLFPNSRSSRNALDSEQHVVTAAGPVECSSRLADSSACDGCARHRTTEPVHDRHTMTPVLPRVNAKSSLRSGEVPLVIHLSTKPPGGDVVPVLYLARRRSGLEIDRPAKLFRRRHFWQAAHSMRPRPGRRKSLVLPHKPPQPQDSLGISLTGSAQGWPRAAGIITASISVQYRSVGQNRPSTPAFPRRAAVGGARTEASPETASCVSF